MAVLRNNPTVVGDIVQIVRDQLPDTIRGKLQVAIESDSMQFRMRAKFRRRDDEADPNRIWRTELGIDFSIPPEFLSLLCLQVL